MKNTLRHSILILILLVFAGVGTRTVFAEPSEDHLEADMILMDEYGNILSHYTRERFQLRDGHFIYNDPPPVAEMSFDTANILELVTEKGSRFRVNYFYTREGGGEDQPLPDPLPLSDMPKKGAVIEERPVWVSWTDENMRELSESTGETYDYYWDAYEIPEPKALPGYGYLKLATGRNSVEGEEVPHFAYVYRKGAVDGAAPSLLFENLLEEGRIRTVKAEPFPDPAPEPVDPPDPQGEPGPSPADPVTTPDTVPAATQPVEPQPEPATVPGSKDQGAEEGPVEGPVSPSTRADDPETEPVTEPQPVTRTKPEGTRMPASMPGRTAADPEEPKESTAPERNTTKPVAAADAGEPADPAMTDRNDGKTDPEDPSRNSRAGGVLIFSGLVVAAGLILLLKQKKN